MTGNGPGRLYIGGEWLESSSGALMDTYNPYTEAPIAQVTSATTADVDAAVDAATDAAASWGGLAWMERATVLRELAARIRDDVDRLAMIDVRNAGLPITAARNDVLRAAEELDYFAGIAGEAKGFTNPSSASTLAYTLREPYGVVGRIIPFNHPFNFSAAKVAAPLAAGNSVVLKAPDQTPLASIAFAELTEGLLPPGVLNVLTGPGTEVGAAIAAHPGIPRVAFIGSVETGRAVMRAGAEHIKHVTLELGGKNPMIVCEDIDPALAAREAVNGMNMRKSMGQSCQSNSRVFVHDSIADEFIAEMAATCHAIVIGDPSDVSTEMGPLAFEGHFQRVLGHISDAVEDGGKLVCGGGRPHQFERGYFVAPTVFDGVTPEMRLFGNEVFGPVVAVIRWRDEDLMLAQVNSLELGLTARIWTRDINRATRIVADVDAGLVWVNGNATKPRGIPFGGFKQSGLGKEGGCVEELLSYTREKAVMTAI